MANIFDKIFGAKRDPEIMTKEVVDPVKQAVASPLSAYLAGQVGKGITPYGGDLSATLDSEAESRYKEFLSMDANQFFKEKVAKPYTERFFEDVYPEIQEGYAGNLRGSGRFYGQEEALNKFSKGLAETEANLAVTLPQQQFDMATKYFQLKDYEIQKKVEDYYKTQPQTNPALQAALQFLSSGTSSGTTLLSALDPGKNTSGLGDFLTLLVQGGATYFGATAGAK